MFKTTGGQRSAKVAPKSPLSIWLKAARFPRSGTIRRAMSGKKVWSTVDQRLKRRMYPYEQVQVAWIKQALVQQAQFGEFPAHAKKLENDLVTTPAAPQAAVPESAAGLHVQPHLWRLCHDARLIPSRTPMKARFRSAGSSIGR